MFALAYASRAADVFRKSDQDTAFGNAVVDLVTAEQYRKAGRYDKAEVGYLKVLELMRRHLGERHPLVMLQVGNLAGLYRKKGDLVKAEQTVRTFMDLVRPMPAFRSQPMVVDALMQYADEVRQRRSAIEAESMYREALQYACERPQGNERNIAALEQRLADLQKKAVPKK